MSWPTITGTRYGDWIYQGTQHPMKHQGWKMHITARPRTSAVNIISAVCRRNRATVKFLPDRHSFNSQTGEQRGKWCAIYPSSTLQAFVIAAEMSEELSRAGCKRMRANERPPFDLYVCKYVCVRYGPYVSKKLINDLGALVNDTWKTNTYRPPWVDDPWVNFNAMLTPGSRQGVDLGAPYPEYRLR